MKNPRLIRKRISSIKNIHKITKALEMVAASKVQKAQDKALSGKPYAQTVYSLIQNFAGKVDPNIIPLLRVPPKIQNALYLLITTNRGLCGSLNTNLFRFVEEDLKNLNLKNPYFITLGKEGRNFAVLKGKLLADFSDQEPFLSSVPAITKLITDSFANQEYDLISLAYNDFVSAFVQEPRIKQILPITTFEKETEIKKNIRFSFEPSAEVIFENLLPFYLEIQIREAIIEAEASEHSARMIAMKNASDNAKQLSYGLILEYNQARQQTITNELSDIVTARLTID